MIRNIKEAKELLEIYKALTIEEIEKRWKEVNDKDFIALKVMRGYSGFGCRRTYPLCAALNYYEEWEACGDCVWSSLKGVEKRFRIAEPCEAFESPLRSFHKIAYSKSPSELLTAVQERIVLLEEAIRLSEKKNEEER